MHVIRLSKNSVTPRMHISRKSPNLDKWQINVKVFFAFPRKHRRSGGNGFGDAFTLEFSENAAVLPASFHPVTTIILPPACGPNPPSASEHRNSAGVTVVFALPDLHKYPKTQSMDPEAGRRVEAMRGPATLCAGLPASAPHCPELSPDGPFWIRHRAAGVRALPVLDPFVDISEHVVKTISVRGFLSYRMRLLVAVKVLSKCRYRKCKYQLHQCIG